MNPTIRYAADGQAHITVPAFNARYLHTLFSCRCHADLAPLFRRACDPVKEWTESMAAYHKLRRWLRTPTLVLHVGDGAHGRTGLLFAFMSGHTNVSIDPNHKQAAVDSWVNERASARPLERWRGVKAKAEDVLPGLVRDWVGAGNPPVLLTFVHAHVDVRALLESLPIGSWTAAYTCACCEKARQLVPPDLPDIRVHEAGDDWAILSPERSYQVLVPR